MKNKNFSAMFLTIAILGAITLTAGTVSAAGLTEAQINAIVGLLQSFGASPSVINNVQISLSGGSSTTDNFCHNWTRNLRVGDRGDAVDALITALVREGFIPNPSNERIYGEDFNEQVASAIVEFQEKYASEILTPNNLRRGTGYVGASTRAKLNRLYRCGVIQFRIPALIIEPDIVQAGQNTTLTIKIKNALPNAEIVLYHTDPDSPTTNSINSDVIGTTDSSGIFVKSDNATYGVAGGVYTYWVTVGGIKSNIVNVNVIPTSAQPSITVTYPKGGENMVAGDPMLIRWTPTVSVSVIEIVSTAGNYSFGIYGPKYGNTIPITTGEYTYIVVNTTPAGSYYVRITPTDGSAQAISKTFTINRINQPITVLSPNGGESWAKGTKQTIKWQDNTPVPTCPEGYLCGSSAIVLKYYDIKLAPYYPPCPGQICTDYVYRTPYTIAKEVRGYSYIWNVGLVKDLYDALAPDGSYTVQICQSGTNTCDSSDSYFKIYSASSNLPPVIDGVSGPTSLNAGETGTWSVKAHDPENGNLSYIVNWGDGINSGSTMRVSDAPLSVSATQSTTFTHSYSNAGTYTVKFTVTDNKGLTAQSSISVQVGVTQPSATITTSAQTTNPTPYIIGTANGVNQVGITLSNSGGKVYGSGLIPVVNGNWSVTVSPALVLGQYTINVYDTNNNLLTTGSINIVSSITTQPSITVLSPNGGETIRYGEPHIYRWKSNMDGSVDLTLTPYPGIDAGLVCLIVSGANASAGELTLAIKDTGSCLKGPSQILPGNYKLLATLRDNYSTLALATDMSDSYFTIATATISLTNGQIIENLVNILKKCAVEAPPLRCLDFDLNGNGFITGADINLLKGLSLLSDANFQSVFNKLMAAVEKSSFSKVGDPLFDHLLDVDGNGVINIIDVIKIRNALGSTRSTQPSITVLSPNGGEVWPVGSTQVIKWNNTTGGSVNITLSNYFACWTANPACGAPAVLYQLANNVSGSAYNWTTGKTSSGGDIPAGEYKITVSSATNGSVTDQSDSAFTVIVPAPTTTTSSLNPEAVSALAEFSQKKNLNLASILAAIAQLIEAFK